MRGVYPIIIYKKEDHENYHCVYIPDVDRVTQGEDLFECINMARDILGIEYVEREKNGRTMPESFTNNKDQFLDDEILEIEDKIFVDIDFDEYKRKNEQKAVKKNCTIPGWLAYKAEEEGLNFSKVLQDALLERLQN